MQTKCSLPLISSLAEVLLEILSVFMNRSTCHLSSHVKRRSTLKEACL